MTTYLITGGTGTLGLALTLYLLSQGHKVRAFARNEHGHERLFQRVSREARPSFSSLIGDVRDRTRLVLAMRNVDIVIHAAAQKIIPLAEYNPTEAIATNIMGTINVLDACLVSGVKKAILISTDKASAPSTLYGATKLVSERAWLAANVYCGNHEHIFSALRYGNVWGSQGSVIYEFLRQRDEGIITLTDRRMTRFHLRLDGAVQIVMEALERSLPGEIYVPKIPSYSVAELSHVIAPNAKVLEVGRRPGEKLSESLISEDESCCAREFGTHYLLSFSAPLQAGGWAYTSSTNQWRLSHEDLKREVEYIEHYLGGLRKEQGESE